MNFDISLQWKYDVLIVFTPVIGGRLVIFEFTLGRGNSIEVFPSLPSERFYGVTQQKLKEEGFAVVTSAMMFFFFLPFFAL